MTPNITLTGSTSAPGISGSSSGSANVFLTLIDVTNHNTETLISATFNGSTLNENPLSVSVGDIIQLSVTFSSLASQSWNTDVSPAFADFSHTFQYSLTDFTSDSGFDYSPTAAATPRPAALPLFATGLGALGVLGWRRKRKTAA